MTWFRALRLVKLVFVGDVFEMVARFVDQPKVAWLDGSYWRLLVTVIAMLAISQDAECKMGGVREYNTRLVQYNTRFTY